MAFLYPNATDESAGQPEFEGLPKLSWRFKTSLSSFERWPLEWPTSDFCLGPDIFILICFHFSYYFYIPPPKPKKSINWTTFTIPFAAGIWIATISNFILLCVTYFITYQIYPMKQIKRITFSKSIQICAGMLSKQGMQLH